MKRWVKLDRYGVMVMEPLLAPSGHGRTFTGFCKVRMSDISPQGHLRLDSVARFAQDVSNDDTTDAGLDDEPGWVVRSTTIDELVPANYGDVLEVVTFCSALGKGWAERRLSIRTDAASKARYEIATLWVCVDSFSARPRSLTQQFISIYAEAAAGRQASARSTNPKFSQIKEPLSFYQWQVRKVDFDIRGHVNNAAYWAALEELTDHMPPRPRRCRIEYGAGIAPEKTVELAHSELDDGRALWWLVDDRPVVAAKVQALPLKLYGH